MSRSDTVIVTHGDGNSQTEISTTRIPNGPFAKAGGLVALENLIGAEPNFLYFISIS